MVVTSQVKDQHAADLEELFTTIAKYILKMNPEKCVFGVEAGKFLGFLLIERGIEANPEKCAAIIAMRSPISVDRADGRFVQIRVSSWGQGAPLFPMFQETHQVRMDQGVREIIPHVEGVRRQPTSTVQATTR